MSNLLVHSPSLVLTNESATCESGVQKRQGCGQAGLSPCSEGFLLGMSSPVHRIHIHSK